MLTYKLTFEFQTVEPHPQAGIGWQPREGSTTATGFELAELYADPDNEEILCGLICDELAKTGLRVIRNTFKLKSVTPT